MTTYEDDFVRLHLVVGTQTVPLQAFGLEWPPPERIVELNGVELGGELVRVRMSQITDEERAGMTHVARGAEYYYADRVPSDQDLV